MIIGTGVDITEVGRLRKAIEKWGKTFLNRVFTEIELKNAQSRASFYQHLAGRFAAKEAVFKAMGNMKLGLKEIQVLNDKNGKPYCQLLNAKNTNKDLEVLISISHVKNYAVANAVVTKKS
jgi:holo-[acyl-carrier protein] synthase